MNNNDAMGVGNGNLNFKVIFSLITKLKMIHLYR